MGSRFVPAGAEPARSQESDEWAQARERVEANKTSKPVEHGQQEGGKSLYEVLQANKAAKQDAFEEANRLRNQFRSLDESEVEFLDSIRQAERDKQIARDRENEEQVETFRRHQQASGQLSVKNQLESTAERDEQSNSSESWIASKKRRRDRHETTAGTKVRKTIPDDPDGDRRDKKAVSAVVEHQSMSKEPRDATDNTGSDQDKKAIQAKLSHNSNDQEKSKLSSLGLDVYSSDSDG